MKFLNDKTYLTPKVNIYHCTQSKKKYYKSEYRIREHLYDKTEKIQEKLKNKAQIKDLKKSKKE